MNDNLEIHERQFLHIWSLTLLYLPLQTQTILPPLITACLMTSLVVADSGTLRMA